MIVRMESLCDTKCRSVHIILLFGNYIVIVMAYSDFMYLMVTGDYNAFMLDDSR